MKRTKRFVAAGAVLASLTGGLLLSATGCARNADAEAVEETLPRPAKIVSVEAVAPASRRSYPGVVRSPGTTPLSFRVGGPVVEVAVREGERVEKGQLLARIDPRDYRVAVRRLEAELAAGRAKHEDARLEHERVRGLFEHDSVSKADYDRSRAALEMSAAEVEALGEALAAARLALEDTELRAPFAGVIAATLVEEHETPEAMYPVLRMHGLDRIEVRIDVPEREISWLLEEGTRFEARLDGDASRSFSLALEGYATEADALTKTYEVRLSMDAPRDVKLLPGMTMTVSASRPSSGSTRALVPVLALATTPENGTFVWRVHPETMTLERAPVEVGELTDAGLQILSGVVPGDRVLAAGTSLVAEGEQVRPMKTTGM